MHGEKLKSIENQVLNPSRIQRLGDIVFGLTIVRRDIPMRSGINYTEEYTNRLGLPIQSTVKQLRRLRGPNIKVRYK